MIQPKIKISNEDFDEFERLSFELLNLTNLSLIHSNEYIELEKKKKFEERCHFIYSLEQKYGQGNFIRQEDIFELQYQDTINRLYKNFNDENFKCREITFQITSDCNLKCSYCYEHHKTKEKMSLITGKKIVDSIFENLEQDSGLISNKLNGLVLAFIGGEPMLEAKLIEQIVDYFIEQGVEKRNPIIYKFKISICTNGQNWFSEDVQHLINKYHNFLYVTVSIDGIKELHDKYRLTAKGEGSFDKAYAAFLDGQRRYGWASSKMTFVPNSFEYIYDSVVFMLKNKCDAVMCNCAYEPLYTKEDARKLWLQLKKVADYKINNNLNTYISILDQSIGTPYGEDDDRNYCGGTGNMLAYDPYGNAYPCIRFAPISLGEKASDFILGDFSGLFKTLKQTKIKDYLDSITMSSQSSDNCKNCKIAKGCGWCSGHNYEETGDVNKRATNICNAHKGRVIASYYYKNKRFALLGEGYPVLINIEPEEALTIINEQEWDELTYWELMAFKRFLEDQE